MPHRRWLERVGDELARRGVPARFRGRLVAELRDHADDLTDGGGEAMTDEQMEARLGRPAALAAHADGEYRRARFASRHPLVVFGLLPLPATVLVFVATVLIIGLAVNAVAWLTVGGEDNVPRPVVAAVVSATAWAVRFVPFAVVAALFTRAYVRGRVSGWWFAAAAAQVLAVAGTMVSLIRYDDDPGQSQWLIGLAWAPVPTADGWALLSHHAAGWMQAAQVAVPVAVGALVFRAAHRRQAALAGC